MFIYGTVSARGVEDRDEAWARLEAWLDGRPIADGLHLSREAIPSRDEGTLIAFVYAAVDPEVPAGTPGAARDMLARRQTSEQIAEAVGADEVLVLGTVVGA